jgi:processive rubber oxygenase RoxA-like protein
MVRPVVGRKDEPAAPARTPGGALARFARAHRRLLLVLAGLVAAAGLLAIVGWYKLFHRDFVEYRDEEDNFKYGSIGAEDKAGIPFYVWKVLPRVCPDLVPGRGGYAAFGMIYEPGHDAPIGFSVQKIGFPRIAINCAFCHTGTVREREDAPPRVVLGGGADQLDAQAYLRFLFGCAADPRFNADNILEEMRRDDAPLSWLDRALYRHLLVPQTRKGLLQQRDDYAWTEGRPRWGRGRIEPFNPVKFNLLKLPVDSTLGMSDFLPLWKMTPSGASYHWDGLNTDLGEVVRSSALGDGATTKSIALGNLERLQRWMIRQAPPSFPSPVDPLLAALGKRVFESAGCADCHAPHGKRFRTVIPVDEPGLGTDRHRVDMWTSQARDTYMKYADGHAWAFHHFQKTNGYVAMPLDGIWLRGPYLHNGSVPTLDQLLSPDRRVARFYRGSDVLDPKHVGFQSQPPEDKARAARFLQRTTELDTTIPGNGNQGHTYGADLRPEDKAALLEYMKTL